MDCPIIGFDAVEGANYPRGNESRAKRSQKFRTKRRHLLGETQRENASRVLTETAFPTDSRVQA